MKRLAKNTTIVVATLIGIALVWRFRGVVLLFFASLATAAALRPIADELVRRGWRRSWALAGTYFAVVGGLFVLFLWMLDPLAQDVERLTADLTRTYQHVRESWPEGNRFQSAIAAQMPPVEELGFSVENGADQSTIRAVLGVTAGIAGAAVQGVFVIVLSLYWSFDRVYFERLWLSLLNVELRQPARTVWRTIEAEAGAYLHSETVQCLAAGVMLWIGYAVMGHPYPVLLAVVGALAWLFPWIGGVIAVAFVIVFSLPVIVHDSANAETANMWTTALPAAIYTFLVLTFLEFVIEPKLFNRRRYNALLLVLVALCLVKMIGLLGLLLAPPLAAAIQVLVEQLTLWRPPEEVQVAAPHLTIRDRIERLRALLAEPGEARPDLVNLVERLSALVDKTEVAAADGALDMPPVIQEPEKSAAH